MKLKTYDGVTVEVDTELGKALLDLPGGAYTKVAATRKTKEEKELEAWLEAEAAHNAAQD